MKSSLLALLFLATVASQSMTECSKDSECKNVPTMTLTGDVVTGGVCATMTVTTEAADGKGSTSAKACFDKSWCGQSQEIDLGGGNKVKTEVVCGGKAGAGVIIGGVVGVLILLGVGGFCYKKRKDAS